AVAPSGTVNGTSTDPLAVTTADPTASSTPSQKISTSPPPASALLAPGALHSAYPRMVAVTMVPGGPSDRSSRSVSVLSLAARAVPAAVSAKASTRALARAQTYQRAPVAARAPSMSVPSSSPATVGRNGSTRGAGSL